MLTDSPRRCFPIHWLSWCLSLTGIVMLLWSHGHYTVDVIIAYYATTTLFWIYHTLANNPNLKVIITYFQLCIYFQSTLLIKTLHLQKHFGIITPNQSSRVFYDGLFCFSFYCSTVVQITSFRGCGGTHCFGTSKKMLAVRFRGSTSGLCPGLAGVMESTLIGTVSEN